jgi:hypothetical protein
VRLRSLGLVIAIVLAAKAAAADEPPRDTTASETETSAPAAPAPKAEEPEPAAPQPKNKLTAYITGGAAIAAAAAGAAFGVRALSLSSDYADHPTYHGSNVGENTAFVADVCFGAAFTFALTTVVLFLKKDASPKKAALDPGVFGRF